MKNWAGENTLPRRAPNAAWAWEGLRRNTDYRRVYTSARNFCERPIQLYSGAYIRRMRSRDLDAEKFGLLCFADPNQHAINADVFWRPDLLVGCLDVRLSPLTRVERTNDDDVPAIFLHRLQTRRVLLETVDGARHIVLNGRRFWIQLYCKKPVALCDEAHIGIRLNTATVMERHLDTASQLLSLYRAQGGKLRLIGRRKNTEPLRRALIAHDIWTGFERPKGGLREIAIALVGQPRVDEDWAGCSRSLKDMARRARDKGLQFVDGDYRELLGRSVL